MGKGVWGTGWIGVWFFWVFQKALKIDASNTGYGSEMIEHEDDSHLRVETFGSSSACAIGSIGTGTAFLCLMPFTPSVALTRIFRTYHRLPYGIKASLWYGSAMSAPLLGHRCH